MVAIVSGNSLGLNLTSAGVLGQRGIFGTATTGGDKEGVYVNAATGNLILDDADAQFMYDGGAKSVTANRVYNSASLSGNSWAQMYAAVSLASGTLNTANSTLTLTGVDGSAQNYTYDTSRGLYVSTDGGGTYDTISYDAGTQTFTRFSAQENVREVYDAANGGRILARYDVTNNANYTSYTYNNDGTLASMGTATELMSFTYDANKRLTSILSTTPDNTTAKSLVQYGYDSSGRLTSVSVDLSPDDGSTTDGDVYQTFYTYDGTSDRIASISNSSGGVTSFTYVQVGGQYRVATVTDPLGSVTNYTYDTTANTTSVQGPAGGVTTYAYDSQGQITSVTTPAVNGTSQITSYQYDTSGNVIAVTDPEGNTVHSSYDDMGRLTGQTDQDGNTVAYTYLPDSTDPSAPLATSGLLSSTTVYANPASGSNAASDPQTSRNVYDLSTGLLRFTISADGRVTEYRYDSNGNRVSTITYAGDLYPVAGLTPNDNVSLDTMTNWAAGANQAATRRVDATYDSRGMLTSTTTYNIVAADGTGVADGTAGTTRYVYGPQGQLLQTIAPDGGTTLYTYDGLGRLISTQDAAGNVTSTQYDDAGNQTVLRQANGLVTTSTYDKNGHLISVQKTGPSGQNLGETTYGYDVEGNLVMTTDPTGLRHFYLYDADNRKIGEVDEAGELTEYRYNADNQVAGTTHYATTVVPSWTTTASGAISIQALAGLRPASTSQDQTTWQFYDAEGRVAKTVDGTGDVTGYVYDGASRVTEVIHYATAISTSNLGPNTDPSTIAPAASQADEITYNYYDPDGLLTGTVDAAGYLTEYQYDASGRQIQTIKYAQPVTGTPSTASSLDTLHPAASADDIHTYEIYNARGQVVGNIDGDGYLTEYVYNGSGNLTTKIQYAAQGPAYVAGMTLAQLRPQTSAADQVQSYTYTNLNQVSTWVNAEGNQTQYVYDSMGNLTSTISAAGTADARGVLSRYDAQGRLIEQLSGEGAAQITGNQTQAEIDTIWQQYGTSYTYDAAGRRTSATNAAGQTTLYYYDADGRLTYTVNALGDVDGHVYDNLGQLVETVQYAGRLPLTGLAGGVMDSNFELALASLANATQDSSTTYTYNNAGKVLTETDATGTVITHDYDAFGNETLRTTTNSAQTEVGALTSFSYDKRNQLLQTVYTDPVQGSSVGTKSQTYDAFGRTISSTDANGNITTYEYDQDGRTIVDNDAGNQSSSGYDAFGNVVWREDALGNRTTYTYDTASRSITVTSPEGVAVTTVHNAFGQTVQVTDGDGNVTSYTYDRNGDATGTTTALTHTSSEYDRIGRLTETVDANGVTTVYDYDAANNLLSRTVDPNGLALTTQYAYDGKGQQIQTTDPNGVVTSIQYDVDGRVLRRVVDPGGLALTTSYSYDALGDVLQVTDPNGIATAYTYDALGRRTKEQIDPTGLNLTTQYTYDGDGNVVAKTNANGNTTRYVYDAHNQLTLTIDAEGDVSENAYDADGRIVRTVQYTKPISLDGLATVVSDADIRSRLQAAPGSDPTQFNYYDADGNLSATVDGTGSVVAYAHDGNGNVTQRTTYASTVSVAALSSGGSLTLPTPDVAHDQRTRIVYDALGRAVYTVDGTGAVVEQRYDGNGNVVDRIAYANRIPVGTAATADAIAAAIVPDAGHDKATSVTYDAANRATYTVNGIGAVTHTLYDNDGNVVRSVQYATLIAAGSDPSSVSASSSDRITDYVYDNAGRVAYSVDPTGAVTHQILDADGNVIQSVAYVNTVAASAAPRTLAQLQASVVPNAADRVQTYVYDNAGRQVMRVDAEMEVTATTYDGVGNVVQATTYATALAAPGSTLEGVNPATLTIGNLSAYLTTSANDRITRTAYDRANRAVYTVDPMGYVKASQYDGAGRMVQTRSYANAITASGLLNTQAIAALLVPDNTRDPQTFYTYDSHGRLLGKTDALGRTEYYTYDGAGNKLTYENKSGATWTYDYDAAGNLVTETDPPVDLTNTISNADGSLGYATSPMVSVINRYAYDAFGNLVSQTEASGRPEEKTTSYVYDAAGRQIQTIFAPVNVYAPQQDDILNNGATGAATRAETQNVSLSSSVLYDAFGDAIAGRDTSGNVSYKVYDKAGRVTYEVDSEGYVTEHQYDTFGDATLLVRYANKTTLSQANTFAGLSGSTVESTVNAAGIDHGSDRSIITQYDRVGHAVEVINPTTYAYDSSAAAGSQYFTAAAITRSQYNAFGQVVSISKLVNPLTQNWATTTQYYDSDGNKTATIDPLGYLSVMSYDAEGNLLSQRDYATATTSWSTASYVVPALSDSDRIVDYTYDLLNQKTSEMRVNVEYSADSTGTFTRGNLTTSYGYDALGNQTRVTDAAGNNTYTYYDALGRVIATAQPAHADAVSGGSAVPLTEFGRDALGNVVYTRQYANGAASESETSYTAGAISSADRITLARFDSRGNTIQTVDADGNSTYMSYNAAGLLAKQWRPVTGNDGITRNWFEAYQYNRLGQQTDVIDPASTAVLNSGITTSYTSGALQANGSQPTTYTVSGTSSVNLNWSSLIDTTGGTVRVQVSYNTVSTLSSETISSTTEGGVVVGEGGYTPVSTVVTTGSPSIATSRTVDFSAQQAASGASISWTDANQTVGGIANLTYIQIWQLNAAGQWVSMWAGTPAQASGTGVSDVSQAQAGWSDSSASYNAFGEVTSKGVNGGQQEYYQYDNAGNLIRTNSGDGVDKIDLYNLQGKQTSNMTSSGSTDIKLIATLDQAAQSTGVARTDTVYDLDGNTVQTVEPARSVYQGGVQVVPNYTGVAIDSSATLSYVTTTVTTGGTTDETGTTTGGTTDETGTTTGGTTTTVQTPVWQGTNTIRLSWNSLADLGDGDVRVVATYLSGNGTAHTLDQTYAASQAQSGVVFSWNGAGNDTLDGGVSSISSLAVYKRDADGNWQQITNNQGTFGNTGNFIDVAAPVDPSIGVELQLADSSGNWQTVTLTNFGDGYRYDASSLPFGNYQYRVLQVARDGSSTVFASGSLALNAPALNTISSTMGFGTIGSDVFSWPSFGNGYQTIFNYRPVGATTWTNLPVTAHALGQDGVNWGSIGVGQFEYELLVVNKTTGMPYAHATGVTTKNAAVPDRYVPPVGYPALPGSIGLGSNTTVIWTESSTYDTGTATLTYTLPSGAQGAAIMTDTITSVTTPPVLDESGAVITSGSTQYTTTYSASFGQVPVGATQFTITYVPAGSSVPTGQSSGTISQGATPPGYYTTQYYYATVPVQVWVPATTDSEGGTIPGYWVTQYQQELLSQQVWVAGVTPAPGMTMSPSNYVPGYTIAGHPPTYSVSDTTAQNPDAISVASGTGGAIGAQTTVGFNGGSLVSQPTINRTYDRWGNVLSVTDPRSASWVTTYTYNANNQILSEVRPTATGAPGAGPTTQLYYDALGHQVAQRDADGNVNGTVYDAAGDTVEELHADGGVVKYDYNALGDKITWVDAMGNRTAYTYDNMNRLLTTANQPVAVYGIDGAGNLSGGSTVSITQSNTYDQMGNRLTTTDGTGAITYYRYDLRGNVTGVRAPGIGVEVRSAYDAQSHKIFESDADGNGATWTYDYFGELTAHKDIGGAQYSYTYNDARQLIDESNTRGQHLQYTYDTAGQVTQITDLALNQVTQYTYDNAGNKVREKTTQNGVVYQDNYLAYDALGLLRDVSDGHVHESIDYDANGNRTHIKTAYLDSSLTMQNSDAWYGYDAMNRQTTVAAADAALDINAEQGHTLTFDYNGNRTSDTYWDKTISAGGAAAGLTTERYTYDGENRLVTTTRDGFVTDQRYYDADDRVVQSGIDGSQGAAFYTATGLDATQQRNTYDAAGRLAQQNTLAMGSSGLAAQDDVTYTSYDNAGNVLQYQVQGLGSQQYVNTYTYTLGRYEGYVETAQSGTSNVYQSGTTTYGYDVNGNMTSVTDQQNSANNQTLVNDVNGKILQRTQNGTTIRSLMVNGELMGTTGPAAGEANFTPSYRPIDASNPQAAPGEYTVQAGDTLQGIAQMAYGDSSLWYLIADNNGLSGDRDLRVGSTVNIPNRVSGNNNTYQTFKPYDPGKIVGDTTPTLPVPPPQSTDGGDGGDGGCGVVGLVIVAVVAVVATALSYGALSGPSAAAVSAAEGAEVGAGAAAGAGASAGAAGATAAASASAVAADVAAAAVAGAIGSIVSQGVALAIGVQKQFSWSAVGTSALASGVSAGVADGLSSIAADNPSSVMAQTLGSSGTPGMVARAVISNTVTQGLEIATGLQSKFSWISVAASAVGAAVGSEVHQNLGGSQLVNGTVSALAAGTTAAVLSGGRANYVQVAVDAFGNALGNSIAQGILSWGSTQFASNTKSNDTNTSGEEARGSLDGLSPADATTSSNGGGNTPTLVAMNNYQDNGGTMTDVGNGNGIGISSGTTNSNLNSDANLQQWIAAFSNPSAPGPARKLDDFGNLTIDTSTDNTVLPSTTSTDDSVPSSNTPDDNLGGSGLRASLTNWGWQPPPEVPDPANLNLIQPGDHIAWPTVYTGDSSPSPTQILLPVADFGVTNADDLQATGNALWGGIKGVINSGPTLVMSTAKLLYASSIMQEEIDAGMDPNTAYTSAQGEADKLWDGRIVSYGNDPGAAAGGVIGETFGLPLYGTAIKLGSLGLKAGASLLTSGLESVGFSSLEGIISPATNSAIATDATVATPKNYGVAFFGADNYTKYYSGTDVLIGAPGGKPFFFMPLEDSGLVTNAGDAARYTGMAPSAQKAYMNGGDIYGISFPTDGMSVRLPTAADANGWPHYLEGGNTAVKLEGPNAGYLLNPTREFVLPGGSPAPTGSVIFKLGPNSEWIPLRRF